MNKSFSGWSRSALAKVYCVDSRLIVQWLKDIGITHSNKLSPSELALFIDKYGIPNNDMFIEYAAYLKKLMGAGLLKPKSNKKS